MDSSTEQLVPRESISHSEGVSKFGAVFIVCNAALGAGLLNFPYAYALAGGWRISLIMQVLVLLLSICGLHFLAKAAKEKNVSSYQDTVREVVGVRFGIMSMTFIMLYTFGCCITFQIVLGDQLDLVFEQIFSNTNVWFLDRRFTITVIGFASILPLCIPKDIGFLRHASLLGFLSCIFVVFVIVTRYADPTADQVPRPSVVPEWPYSISSFMSALPSLFFAYQCHVSSVPIYASMADQSPKSWILVAGMSLICCCFVYTLAGTFGYLTFGLDVNPDILKSYPANDPLVIVARALIAVVMITSYPILAFCGRSAFLSISGLDTFYPELTEEEKARKEKWRRIIPTIVWFCAALALAISVPNIADVISVIGSLAAFFIMIFPGLIMVDLAVDHVGWQKSCLKILQVSVGSVLIIVGVWIFGVTTTLAILNF